MCRADVDRDFENQLMGHLVWTALANEDKDAKPGVCEQCISADLVFTFSDSEQRFAPEVSSALREREVGRAAWALWDARALRAGVADSDFALDERRERRVDDALVGVLTVTIA